MLKKKGKDIDSHLEDLPEDQINALFDEDLSFYTRFTLADQDNNNCKQICKALSKNLA